MFNIPRPPPEFDTTPSLSAEEEKVSSSESSNSMETSEEHLGDDKPDSKRVAIPYREDIVMKGKHIGSVMCIRFNSDGEYCLSGGKDRTVHLWNPHSGKHIQAYTGVHGYDVLDIAVSSDNSKFVSCGGDKLAFYWDVPSAKCLRRLRGHTERLNCCGLSPEGTVAFTGSYDASVRVWDLKGNLRDPIQVMTEFTDSVTSLLVTDHSLIAGSVDGKLRIFDIRMGKMTTDHVCQPITSVSLSNDRNCILVSSTDSTLRLFDKATGELLNEYTGHMNRSYKIESCFNNDDCYIVSGSEDHVIYFWNLVEATVVHKLKGHTKEVVSLSYHPKETALLTASTDGTIRLWR
jgi:mitogen-activated protein kinase organizer 1